MKKIITAVLLVAGSSVAWADTPSYSLIEIDYSIVDITGFDEDSRALSIVGSVEISDHTFVVGSYGRSENNDLKDRHPATIGVGYFSPIAEDAAWHTAVQYLRYNHGSYHDDRGLTWTGGIRKNVSESLELYGDINALYLDDSGTQVGLSTGVVFHTASGLGLNLGLSFNDDNASAITAGVRYTF